MDEAFVKINGKRHHLWRAVDHGGEVPEAVVAKRRNKRDALKLLRKIMKRRGQADEIVTDRFVSYGAALRELGATDKQQTGRWLNNRVENSPSRFDGGNEPCNGSGACDVCRSLPPFISPSTTTSTRNAA